MDNNKSYLNTMYVEIDREAYEDSGSIEIVGGPVGGNDLYESMLEEYHGLLSYDALGAGGLSYDIVSIDELCRLLETVGGKAGRIAGYFLRRRNSGNTIKATMQKISEATGISLVSVHKTITDLRNANFIKRGMSAEYMVSPYLIYRGKFSRAAYLQMVYEHFGKDTKPVVEDGEEKCGG